MKDLSIEMLAKRLDSIESALAKFKIPDRSPIADPPPYDYGYLDKLVERRIDHIFKKNPGWISDPPPEDFLNVRVLDLLRRYRGGFTDPAPDDLSNVRLRDIIQRIPGGGFTDPSPVDIRNLTISETESQLHKVNTELVRLNSLKRTLTNRLDEINPTQNVSE